MCRREIIKGLHGREIVSVQGEKRQRKVGKMKVCATIIFLVIIFGVKGKSLNFRDPQKYVNCAQKNKILWPDYVDKRYYFECIGDDFFVKRLCPNKTVFNYKTQECTWPEDWKKPPEIDNLIERENSPSCEKFELHLLWADVKNSQDYFRCTGVGEFERLTCPADRIFNFVVQMCVAVETTTTIETGDRYPDCFENEIHLNWPDPWYPENYFVCTDVGEFELRGCPPGRYFFFMIQNCVAEDEITPIFPMDQKKISPEFMGISPEAMGFLPEITRFPTEAAKISSEVTRSSWGSSRSSSKIPGISKSFSEPPKLSTNKASTTTEKTTPNSLKTTQDNLSTSTDKLTTPTYTSSTTEASATIYYPKLTCVICWRPTCEKHELERFWPDYDNERRYFECLGEGVLMLKRCAWNFVFDFKQQKCVEVDNRV